MMKKSLSKIAALAISSLTTLGAVHAESIPGVVTVIRSSNPVGYNMSMANCGPLVSKSDADKTAVAACLVGIELGTFAGIFGTLGVAGAVVGGMYAYNNYSEEGIVLKNIPLGFANWNGLGSTADRHFVFELVKKIVDNQPSSGYSLKDYISEDLAGIKVNNKKECFNYLCQVVAMFPYDISSRSTPKLYNSATELKNAPANECLNKLQESINNDTSGNDYRKSNAVACFEILKKALPRVDGSHLEKSSLQPVHDAARPAPQEATSGHESSEPASTGVAGLGSVMA